jgi:hypothetical protein
MTAATVIYVFTPKNAVIARAHRLSGPPYGTPYSIQDRNKYDVPGVPTAGGSALDGVFYPPITAAARTPVSFFTRPSPAFSALMKASKSGLITSACVVHMPCGNFS